MKSLCKTICSAIALGSCLTLHAEELSRLTYLFRQDNQLDEEERINIWPLFYKHGSYSTALWPIYDKDETGWSMRPLFTKEKAEYSFLFPISNWNAEKKTGWFMGLAHKDDESTYLFPYWETDEMRGILLSGIGDKGGFVGPFYHFSDSTEASTGIFPLAGKSRNGSEHSYYAGGGLLSYWRYDENNPDHLYWVFPWFDYQSGDDFVTSTIPLYAYYKSNEGKVFISALGIAGYNNQEKLEFLNVMGLLYHYGNDKHRVLGGALSYIDNQSEDEYKRWIAPWYSSANYGRYQNVLFPFYYYDSEENKSRLFTPFFGLAQTGEDKRLTNFLGPVYIDASDNEARRRSFLAPLSYFEQSKMNGDYSHRWVFPWYNSNIDGKETSILFPLVYMQRTNDNRKSVLITPLFAKGHDAHGGKAFTSVMGPLFLHIDDPDEIYRSFMWPLLTYKKRDADNRSTFNIFPFLFNRTREKENTKLSALLGAIGLNTSDSSWRVWPLLNYKQQNTMPSTVNIGKDEWDILSVCGYSHTNRVLEAPEMMCDTSAPENQNLYLHSKKALFTSIEVTNHKKSPFGGRLYHTDEDYPEFAYRMHKRRVVLFDYERTESIRFKEDAVTDEEKRALSALSFSHAEATAKAFLDEKGISKDLSSKDKLKKEMHDYLSSVTERTSKTKWKVPFLVHSEKMEASSHFDVLWYLYRSDKYDTMTTRSIFPFMESQSSPKKKSFSFMWRVFNYENKAGQRKGHLFFIPWKL